MRHSTEPKERKSVEGYGFSSLARNFGNKYGKKLIGTTTTAETDWAKTVLKIIFKKA